MWSRCQEASPDLQAPGHLPLTQWQKPEHASPGHRPPLGPRLRSQSNSFLTASPGTIVATACLLRAWANRRPEQA